MKPKRLSELRKAARNCQACDLYKRATQTVFGAGPRQARLMLVGEQPGDREDRAGLPFVGQAGILLDRLCEELEIPREEIYVTNAVKHFKWERSGKIRLHKKPNAAEVQACRHWLTEEIEAIKPRVILCLGMTAVKSVLDRVLPIGASRGRKFSHDLVGTIIMITWHPSAALRAPSHEARLQKRTEIKGDLRRAWLEAHRD